MLYLGFKVAEMDIKLDGIGGDIRHVYENLGMLFFPSLDLTFEKQWTSN
jgi:hypothetical protein